MASALQSAALRSLWFVALLWGGAVTSGLAQSVNATLTGTVVDKTGAVLPAAEVLLTNVDTAISLQARAGAEGGFTVPSLSPGRYVLRVSHPGFAPVEMRDIVLNVGDRVAVRVILDVATVGETATVVAEPQRVNTSPSVGIVVDRQFVENMPLNGRSLHALLELTPGVVLASRGSGFAVNGQRTNANYFSVDGVGATAGMSAVGNGEIQGAAGVVPGLSAVGGTNGLVSVDALQEFRLETSTYAPEFGRTPGGQVSLVTRSGANIVHGSAFEYFRHDALDATDWFVNSRGQKKAKLRQHDFGGVIGGPLIRDRTFYFASYEKLHLVQPKAALTAVPSVEARLAAVPAVQSYLNALPLPNGPALGAGSAEFAAVWSDPSRVDTTSVRMDHNISDKWKVFARGSIAPSYSSTRALSTIATIHQNNNSVTGGATWILSPRMVHDMRVGYSDSQARAVSPQPDDFGGAIPPPASIFEAGRGPDDAVFRLLVAGAGSWVWGAVSDYEQRQLNVIDSFTVTSASHEWKFGIDYRRLTPVLQRGLPIYQIVTFGSVTDAIAGRPISYATRGRREQGQTNVFNNLSLYAQDAWKFKPKLTLTYGLRWELVPPPYTTGELDPITLNGLEDPLGGQVTVAPRGTPLWDTRYNHIAPRVGASYVASDRSNMQLVLRGGFGLFYDLGYGEVAGAFTTYPFYASKSVPAPALPLSPAVVAEPDVDAARPSILYAMDRHLKLPVTYQWNVSAEQSLGARQTLTVSYVASEGRDLIKNDRLDLSVADWPGARVATLVGRNEAYGDYRAVQVQFTRRLHRGIQSMVSYTWGRSRDTESVDRVAGPPIEVIRPELDFGYSDYDVRHSLTSAFTYQVPAVVGSGWLGVLAGNWGVDLFLRARTGIPIDITTGVLFPPDTQSVRPNIVPGQSFWLVDANAPGGRRLNRDAFSTPAISSQGDLPRGTLSGFSAKQVDLAVRRDIRFNEQRRLQLRFEVFNLLNTPNFSNPIGQLTSSQFGLANTMLGQGLGGLNPLYQMGGPRSCQVAVKVLF